MPGFTPGSIPLARPGELISVCRYNPARTFPSCYTVLDNVLCLAIERQLGPSPSVANFRYIFDLASPSLGQPQRLEDAFPLNASGPYVVLQDDRLVVLKDDGDGSFTCLFDGFAQVPQGDLNKDTEMVSFQALGVEVREWDTPLSGAVYRLGPDPTVITDVPTGLPARFNPNGLPSMTPVGADSGAVLGSQYPVFFDVKQVPDVRRIATLEMSARYIMGVGNPQETYVHNLDFTSLPTLLQQRTPTGPAFDPNNAATYTASDIPTQDIDVAGDPWPVAFDKLVQPYGFRAFFALDTIDPGIPSTRINVLRFDGGTAPPAKDVYLQLAGTVLDPASNNVASVKLARDSSRISNAIILDTEPVEYEASFILAPGFSIVAGDATTPAQFVAGDANYTGDNQIKYREFVFNEAADGFWNFDAGVFDPSYAHVSSLDAVLGAPVPGVGALPPLPRYASRRRKCANTLISVDSLGKPLHAELWVQAKSDYLAAGADRNSKPAVWDGLDPAAWQRVKGSWSLLKDRIGIRFDGPDPNDIALGVPSANANVATGGAAGGKLRLVKALAAPDTQNPIPVFRLTTCIKGDQDLNATANRRPASTTQFVVTRRVDTRDRFGKQVVTASSIFNTALPPVDRVVLDDTDNAKSYAGALRSAHDTSTFSGSVTIPRFTLAYSLGDSIRQINGRNLSFRQNVGAEVGEAARYPVVVGISWDFDGKQACTIHYEDMRAEPAPERTR